MAKQKSKKPKQTTLPGTEGKTIAEIETAASAYKEARDERMALTEAETKAQSELVTAMQKAGLTKYRCGGEDLLVELVASSKAKVRKVNTEPEAKLEEATP